MNSSWVVNYCGCKYMMIPMKALLAARIPVQTAVDMAVVLQASDVSIQKCICIPIFFLHEQAASIKHVSVIIYREIILFVWSMPMWPWSISAHAKKKGAKQSRRTLIGCSWRLSLLCRGTLRVDGPTGLRRGCEWIWCRIRRTLGDVFGCGCSRRALPCCRRPFVVFCTKSLLGFAHRG
jgi:hypothetical protein